jgi:glycosyltransferase involved in cell wall biosynthesis
MPTPLRAIHPILHSGDNSLAESRPRTIRVLVLTWEFPPRVVGGLSRHVAELYPELVKLGWEIHLITLAAGGAPAQEQVDGIFVHRLTVAMTDNFLTWVEQLNQSLTDYASQLMTGLAGHPSSWSTESGSGFDLIHAHDWLVATAAIRLKQTFQIPLVTTIHATEAGRHNGIYTSEQRHIHDHEQRLAAESERVIVCTNYMRQEVVRSLQADHNRIDVVYNGIRPGKKKVPVASERVNFRRSFAADDEKIVYYVGRLTHEKGVNVLIHAAPLVIRALQACHPERPNHPGVKFVIIGQGNCAALKQQVADLGLWDRFYFTGFMSDQDLDQFQTIANCAVFPSLYEPFGIVALESFSARVPVVVSDAGGLPEVVKHQQTGVVTGVNNPESLAEGILQVLLHPEFGRQLVENAYADLGSRFDWPQIAQQTAMVYGQILAGAAPTSLTQAVS